MLNFGRQPCLPRLPSIGVDAVDGCYACSTYFNVSLSRTASEGGEWLCTVIVGALDPMKSAQSAWCVYDDQGIRSGMG